MYICVVAENMANKVVNIPNLIIDQLLLQGRSSVPGIGTFYNEYTRARFNDDRSILWPPKETLKFDASIDQDYLLADYAVIRLGIKAKKIEKKISRFAEGLINEVLNYGKSEIEGIGTLQQDEQGDLMLVAEDTEATAKYFGLTEVALQPIQFLKSENNTPKNENKPVIHAVAKDEYAFELKHLGMAVLIAAYLFGMYQLFHMGLSNGKNSKPNKEQVTTASDIEENRSDTIASAEGLDYTQDLNGNTDNEVEAAAVAVNKTKGKLVECVIILGAYESDANVESMYKKVTALGYTPYKEYFEDMGVTRVGITFTCEDKDLKSLMHEIRKKVSKDAWYLVPRITID